MNERLKELAFKAYNNAGQGTPGTLSSFMEVYSEKFAELIVRECAKKIREDSGPDDNYNASRNMTIDMMAELIEKHFGVKE